MLGIALLALAAMRIVSLAPSITEDLFAIGAGPQVVAVDVFSDRPAPATHLPRVGSMNDLNTEAIVALHPDLVVGIAFQAPALGALRRAGVRVVALPADDLTDDLSAIVQLGALSGHEPQAERLRARLTNELAALRVRARAMPERSAFVVVGQSPLYTAGPGSFIDDLLRSAHLRNVVPALRVPYPPYSDEQLVAEQPDIIIVEAGTQLRGTPWDRLRAVRAGHVAVLPQGQLFRPGPHAADALRALIAETATWR